VVEELAAAGVTAHLAEPADTAFARGPQAARTPPDTETTTAQAPCGHRRMQVRRISRDGCGQRSSHSATGVPERLRTERRIRRARGGRSAVRRLAQNGRFWGVVELSCWRRPARS
jgi:hypothetical protein